VSPKQFITSLAPQTKKKQLKHMIKRHGKKKQKK
jgi:hypothetical protein